MSLRMLIDDYLLKKEEFKDIEKELKSKMLEAIAQEINSLNRVIKPEGYKIGEYSFFKGTNGKLKIILGEPIMIKENKFPNKEIPDYEMAKLNNLLRIEFNRIEKKYGFEIDGFCNSVLIV